MHLCPHILDTGRSPRPPAGAAGPGHQDLGRGWPGRGGDVAAERHRGREPVRRQVRHHEPAASGFRTAAAHHPGPDEK